MEGNLTSGFSNEDILESGSPQKSVRAVDSVIGAKIAEVRSSLGMTRQDLADKLGITHQQLQKYEKGKNRITIGRFLEICKYLDVSVDYFLGEYSEEKNVSEMSSQRLAMETMRDFASIESEEKKIAIRKLIKVMGKEEEE